MHKSVGRVGSVGGVGRGKKSSVVHRYEKPYIVEYFAHRTLISIFLHSGGSEVRSRGSEADAIALT
ncbi:MULTISPECIES: hypothetical protein [Moorena]|uniref:Uncharacterized protein n=1 Tax=Moorena producens (strain JHB) TaxID=1454205 RepID=A0A9Q9SUK2_MOOP1|nr:MULTISPECIES: hypothetical protein [Moorena]NES85324.1 hypothetical protein [Moorena sp. SIO2B7]NEP36644.1 hypothetical protein [Moorena sp. SIO3B2]NEP69763.1 hypothetical protein [Moorena sp. SIO3A5]NEQ08269.1 hypothetical protein [Moorena sp. SIO4E2]NER89130.1 hypothetical protein [Moorena sp. SIO3A2]